MYKMDEVLLSTIERLRRADPLCKDVKIGMTSEDNVVLDLSFVNAKVRLRCIEKVFRHLVAALYPKGKLPILSENRDRWLVIRLLNVSDIIAEEDIVLRSIIRAIINRALYKGIVLSIDMLEELRKLRYMYRLTPSDKVVLGKLSTNLIKLCEKVGICKGYGDQIVIDKQTIEWFSE